MTQTYVRIIIISEHMFLVYFIYHSNNSTNNKVVRQGNEMSIKVEKIKKIFITLLAVLVSFLVIYAIYSSRSRFYNTEIVRYSQITIDEKTDIQKIISLYDGSKEKIINEIKKVNNLTDLSNESIYGKTIYIPVIAN